MRTRTMFNKAGVETDEERWVTTEESLASTAKLVELLEAKGLTTSRSEEDTDDVSDDSDDDSDGCKYQQVQVHTALPASYLAICVLADDHAMLSTDVDLAATDEETAAFAAVVRTVRETLSTDLGWLPTDEGHLDVELARWLDPKS